MAERRAQDVLDFWFGRGPQDAHSLEQHMRIWFGGDEPPEIRRLRDDDIDRRFGEVVQRAARGELDAWATSPHRRLGLILLLDQFPRNIYRGTPAAFATDEAALSLAFNGMHTGADAALTTIERIFFYMPLQHAESQAVQEESVLAYQRLLQEAPAPLHGTFASCLAFAQQHRDIVQRFGRFPHRNEALGRRTTADEDEYLRGNPNSFGQ
ncbi:MAG: DUF924 family protein [Steroidobacteraceae bacterium]